jgi:hypothetical protein
LVLYAYLCVFAHSRFIENPPIWSWETNPSFLRWFCHITLPHPWPRALGCHSCIESLEALSLRKSSAHLHRSQESEVSIHSAWSEHEAVKMAKTDQGLWVVSPLSSWKGECGCRRSKPQASMQPPHNSVSPFLLWSRRAESPSCSTWQVEQHSRYSNYQRRYHRNPKMDVEMGHLYRRLELGEA